MIVYIVSCDNYDDEDKFLGTDIVGVFGDEKAIPKECQAGMINRYSSGFWIRYKIRKCVVQAMGHSRHKTPL